MMKFEKRRMISITLSPKKTFLFDKIEKGYEVNSTF